MKTNVDFSEETETRIIKYLNGDLSMNDTAQFEKELESNVQLKIQTREVKNIRTILTNPKLIEAEQILLKLRKKRGQDFNENSAKPIRASRLFAPYRIFSMILFLLMFIAVATSLVGTKSNTIYSTFMKPYPINVPEKLNRTQLEQDAIMAYKLATKTKEVGDWENAKYKLEPLATYEKYKIYYVVASIFSQPDDDLANLDILLKYQEAFSEEAAERALNKQQFLWIDYYRALIYFNTGKVRDGKAIISELSKNEGIIGELKSNIGGVQEKITKSTFIY